MKDEYSKELLEEENRKKYIRPRVVNETVEKVYLGQEIDIKFPGIVELPIVCCFPDGTKEILR